MGKHNGRQLSLQPQLGSADLNAVFYGARRSDGESLTNVSSTDNYNQQCIERKHIIQVSTYQMCVLLLFNTHNKMTFEVIYNLIVLSFRRIFIFQQKIIYVCMYIFVFSGY